MSEVSRIHDQLQRAFEGEAWHGPSLRAILAGVDAERAAARPVADAHSIWEIVLHVAAWEDAARKALDGVPLDLAPEEDWPPVPDASGAAWQAALAALEAGHRRLRTAVAGLTDDALDDVTPGRTYSIYVLLHGIVQHDLYHAGQIILLKKA